MGSMLRYDAIDYRLGQWVKKTGFVNLLHICYNYLLIRTYYEKYTDDNLPGVRLQRPR